MSEPSMIADIPTLVITTDTMQMLHCAPVAYGGHDAPYPAGERLRWWITTTDGQNVVGPPIGSDRSPEAVQRDVSAWWREYQRNNPAVSLTEDRAAAARAGRPRPSS